VCDVEMSSPFQKGPGPFRSTVLVATIQRDLDKRGELMQQTLLQDQISTGWLATGHGFKLCLPFQLQ
jgi:hypothetical protein